MTKLCVPGLQRTAVNMFNSPIESDELYASLYALKKLLQESRDFIIIPIYSQGNADLIS